MVFFMSWLSFGIIYYLAEVSNDTLCKEGKISAATCPSWSRWENDTKKVDSEEDFKKKQCVSGVIDFPSAFLFSVETMTTIGYGSRFINPNCPVIIFFTYLQSMCGVLISGDPLPPPCQASSPASSWRSSCCL